MVCVSRKRNEIIFEQRFATKLRVKECAKETFDKVFGGETEMSSSNGHEKQLLESVQTSQNNIIVLSV